MPEELATPLTLRWGALAFTLAGGPTFLMSSTEVGLACGITGSDEVAVASSSVMSKWTVRSGARALLVACGTSGIESPSSAPVGDRGVAKATLLGAFSCCKRRRAVSGNICVRVGADSGGGVVKAMSTSSAGEDEAAGSTEWSASGGREAVVGAGVLLSGSALCCDLPWKVSSVSATTRSWECATGR